MNKYNITYFKLPSDIYSEGLNIEAKDETSALKQYKLKRPNTIFISIVNITLLNSIKGI